MVMSICLLQVRRTEVLRDILKWDKKPNLRKAWKYSALTMNASIWLVQENVQLKENQLTTNYTLHVAIEWHSWKRNKTLLGMVRSMMVQVALPISFWRDVLLTATHVVNRVSFESVVTTPYELWTGNKPTPWYLKSWDSIVFVHFTSHHEKLGPRAKKVHVCTIH